MLKTYRIGELARELEVPVETIRYYEREHLLPEPARSSGNYRLYAQEHRDRLSFIRHCRSLDMTLDEIRDLLRVKDAPEESCADVNALLDSHIGHVAERIAELRHLKRQLELLRSECGSSRAGKDCKILQRLSRGLPPTVQSKRGTVSRTHRR